ncbi:NUDIX domain-containing protein [Phytohabitans aurantiacus]|uniref:Nudix hydrolase domain-containing protein n=1 Tax=Phytohabitans aurantiacus TaxID=3016789 RepID=A0ABQ5R018_9ACTN|nr:NUDIX domain-containing protein [Phytohabitans aurantiacus]GLH99887.1 hypothetical protein Pa4123_51630 [Phytohabitans aurantiacus]
MPAEVETLYTHGRVTLRAIREPEAGIGGYVFAEWYGGQPVIAVLPYRHSPTGLQLLLTDERVPCWPETTLSAVTGAPEQTDPIDDAVRELQEETGFHLDSSHLVTLGWCRDSKGSSTRYQMFAANVTGLEPGPRTGDGSRLEAEATCTWITLQQLPDVRHSIAHVLTIRLLAHLAAERHAVFAEPFSRPALPPDGVTPSRTGIWPGDPVPRRSAQAGPWSAGAER